MVTYQEKRPFLVRRFTSDTPGHPAESQTQTKFVMSYRTLHFGVAARGAAEPEVERTRRRRCACALGALFCDAGSIGGGWSGVLRRGDAHACDAPVRRSNGRGGRFLLGDLGDGARTVRAQTKRTRRGRRACQMGGRVRLLRFDGRAAVIIAAAARWGGGRKVCLVAARREPREPVQTPPLLRR